MNKLQMEPPIGGAMPSPYVVRVQKGGRPSAPWVWKLFQDGNESFARRCDTAYRSAEAAWEAGQRALRELEGRR